MGQSSPKLVPNIESAFSTTAIAQWRRASQGGGDCCLIVVCSLLYSPLNLPDLLAFSQRIPLCFPLLICFAFAFLILDRSFYWFRVGYSEGPKGIKYPVHEPSCNICQRSFGLPGCKLARSKCRNPSKGISPASLCPS